MITRKNMDRGLVLIDLFTNDFQKFQTEVSKLKKEGQRVNCFVVKKLFTQDWRESRNLEKFLGYILRALFVVYDKIFYNQNVMKKYLTFILIAVISAVISGILTQRSTIYGKVFDHFNLHVNGVYSKVWKNANSSTVSVLAISRRVDNTDPQINDDYQKRKVNLSNSDTVVVVMDPWNLTEPITLNRSLSEKLIHDKVIPLVNQFLENDYPVYVATNKCEDHKKINCGVHDDFPQSKKIEYVYHQNETTQSFENKLRTKGIKNLIYLGFSSNQCMLGSRSMSMIPMFHSKFSIYYIPDASAAIETNKTFRTQSIHEANTLTVSQWIAEILDYSEIISALKLNSKWK